MPSIFHTTHTTLMRKTYKGNLGTFIAGSPAIIEKTSEFMAAGFSHIEDGAFMKVTFRVSGDRRYYVNAEQLNAYSGCAIADAIAHFWADNAAELTRQAIRLYRKNAPDGPRAILAQPNGSKRALVSFSEDALQKLLTDSGDYDNATAFVRAPAVYFITGISAVPPTDPSAAKADAGPDEQEQKTPARMTNINAMKEVGGIVAKAGDWHLFEAMKAIADTNIASNILLVGPSGCGKTSMPEAFAASKGMNFLRMNCATIRDPEEWIGYREARDGSTVFVKSEFIKAVEQGNTMIVFDEFNRIEPWLHNTLFPLLDHSRKTVAHNVEVKVGNGTIFAATANIGGRFTGTFVLDAALTNRFDATIQMGYLPEGQEADVVSKRTGMSAKDASKIVAVIRTLRGVEKELELGIDLSIRTSLKVATVWQYSKLPMMAIIDHVVLSSVQDASITKRLIDSVAPVVKSLFSE